MAFRAGHHRHLLGGQIMAGLSIKDAQAVLAAAGFYVGAIDGRDGPMTQAAVIETGRALNDRYTQTPSAWSVDRQRVAAVQAALDRLGYEPGVADGLIGHNSKNALEAFLHKRAYGKPLVIPRLPDQPQAKPIKAAVPRQAECDAFYGVPGEQIKARLVTVNLPYAMRLDYDLGTSISRVTLHQKCAPSFIEAMIAVRAEYRHARQTALGLDRYAGGYMHRKMRGGSRWSMHAYGCAVDFYAEPNGLTTRCPRALFCGAEYKPFLDIMESHGWLPAIRLWGSDAMHLQMARL